jgi:hypothetical protein
MGSDDCVSIVRVCLQYVASVSTALCVCVSPHAEGQWDIHVVCGLLEHVFDITVGSLTLSLSLRTL